MTLYTVGYQGWDLEELVRELRSREALLVDIRYTPFSKRREFSKKSLALRLKRDYIHVPELGNVDHRTKDQQAVRIKGIYQGTRIIRPHMQQRSVILMCACFHHSTCHRSTVAREIADIMQPHVQVEHLYPPKKEKPASPQLDLFGNPLNI